MAFLIEMQLVALVCETILPSLTQSLPSYIYLFRNSKHYTPSLIIIPFYKYLSLQEQQHWRCWSQRNRVGSESPDPNEFAQSGPQVTIKKNEVFIELEEYFSDETSVRNSNRSVIGLISDGGGAMRQKHTDCIYRRSVLGRF